MFASPSSNLQFQSKLHTQPRSMKFTHKIILIISISVFITFLIIDLSLFLLYTLVVPDKTVTNGYSGNQFNQFVTNETLNTNINYIQTGIDVFDDILLGIYHTYEIFSQNSSLYKSNLHKNRNNSIISGQKQPHYRRTGVYLFTPESTFYDEPYMDAAVSCSIQRGHPLLTKRVNLIYQSTKDPTDIMVRTTPETSDFIIPSVESVDSRFQSTDPGSITFTHEYSDQFSKSDNQTQLFAIRIYFPQNNNQDYRMIVEVQILLPIVTAVLRQFYAYKSTAVAMIYIKNHQQKEYVVLGSSTTFNLYKDFLNLTFFLNEGVYNVTITDGIQYMIGTKKMSNQTSVTQKYGLIDRQYDNIIMMTFLNKSETNLADQSYTSFLEKETMQLIEFMLIWSLIVITLMIGIGYAISSYLFSAFNYIKNEIKKYLTKPESIEKAYFQMKQMASKQNQSRILIQNIIAIIQRIESKKKANKGMNSKTKQRKNKAQKGKAGNSQKNANNNKNNQRQRNKEAIFDEYPLNLLDEQFQNKLGLDDTARFQQIRKQIEIKIAAMNRADGQGQAKPNE